MKRFADLFFELDHVKKTDAKVEILMNYFSSFAGIPKWLFEECHRHVGNLGETIMLLMSKSKFSDDEDLVDWMRYCTILETSRFMTNGVLVAAQKSPGRRADLFTDYTFAVWHGKNLVPFTKAYSGLTDREIHEINDFVQNHTRENFGPVRTVTPELVFEIAFEGIQPSRRHKSGVALKFPRISRWRRDKPKTEADTLAGLHVLIPDIRAS